MTRVVTGEQVRAALRDKREIALIDLREEAPFAEAHPLFAASLPLGRIELEIFDRVPRDDTEIVLYDNGEGLVASGLTRLQSLGYSDVAILDGGLRGWRDGGGEIFQDVNTPSKAFGELVESKRHTPSLPAEDVKALIDGQADIVILDARRFDEYATMNIPGSVSVPGAELVLRARDLAPRPETTIVVNCAGRTRSIIGTQSLVNAGIPNKVVALRNGTIGWTLAGQALEHGQSRQFGPVADANQTAARRSSRNVADRAGVKRATLDALAAFERDTARTTYKFDVRTPDEFRAGHWAGFRSAPGGQLVQETDVFAPVRGARIVLADGDGVRANMTGSWLAQMGWDVYALDSPVDGTGLIEGEWQPTLPALPPVEWVNAAKASARLARDGIVVLDFTTSRDYARGHLPGAWFALRGDLKAALDTIPAQGDLLVTSPDGSWAAFAAADIKRLTDRKAFVLEGGTLAWQTAGLPLESGLDRFASEPIDRYRRPYEGTDNPRSAMQAYLDWEYGLVDQLGRDGTHGFFVI